MSKKNYNYIRPNQTYQELMSNQDIIDKLKYYKKIVNINNIPIGTHIRYFTIDTKTNSKLFRLGGFLQKIDPNLRYITLSNNNLSWSVQIPNSILYYKMSEDDIKNELKEELKEEIKNEMTTEINKNQYGGGINNDTITELTNKILKLNKKLESYHILEKIIII